MCLSYSLGLMTNWTQCSQGSGVSISVAVGKTAITGDTQSPHPGDTKSPHSGLRTAQRVQLNPQHSSELLGREDRQTDRQTLGPSALQHKAGISPIKSQCKTTANLGTGFWPLAHCRSSRHEGLGNPQSAFRHQEWPNSPNTPHTPGQRRDGNAGLSLGWLWAHTSHWEPKGIISIFSTT